MARKVSIDALHIIGEEIHGMLPSENLQDILEYELGVPMSRVGNHVNATQALVFNLVEDGPTYIHLYDREGTLLLEEVYPIL